MCIKFTADVTFRCNFQHQWKLIDIYRFCLWCDHELDICCSSDDDGREFFPKIHWISLFRSWDFVQLKIPPVSKFAAGLVWNYATPGVSFGYISHCTAAGVVTSAYPNNAPVHVYELNWGRYKLCEQQQREINECRSTDYGQRSVRLSEPRPTEDSLLHSYHSCYGANHGCSLYRKVRSWFNARFLHCVTIARVKWTNKQSQSDLRKICTFHQSNRVI